MMVFIIAFGIILLFFLFEYSLYRFVFYHPMKKRPEMHRIPDSTLYKEHKEKMLSCIKETEETAHEDVSIVSKDGYRLYGKLYLQGKDTRRYSTHDKSDKVSESPLMLFFHGYHGVAEWDGYGIFRICMKYGIRLLMVDQRAHGKSESNSIAFGVKEREDCRLWIEYVEERFGGDTNLVLAGVSMGAATVMMASEVGLPSNVKAIISDCGYTDPGSMVKEIIRKMKLPVAPVYALVRLSGRMFGHFDLEEASALSAVGKLKLPILFLQGAEDSVVPRSMNDALYEACTGTKKRVIVAGADHANSAMTDYDTYEKAVGDFLLENKILDR